MSPGSPEGSPPAGQQGWGRGSVGPHSVLSPGVSGQSPWDRWLPRGLCGRGPGRGSPPPPVPRAPPSGDDLLGQRGTERGLAKLNDLAGKGLLFISGLFSKCLRVKAEGGGM